MGSAQQRRSRQQKLTVAEILTKTAGQYVAQYASAAAPQVQSALAKLSLCRTAALKGRRHRCETCAYECIVYNSCGDRNCPTCSGAKRADWVDSASELILDGVDYYQVVFTLPSELSRLALGNRKAIYDLLFRSAYEAMKQTVESEHGYDPAAIMVLHTWNQKLEPHAHVHAIVPGGGPSLDGSGWKSSHRRRGPTAEGKYLVDVVTLRSKYRNCFLHGLRRLHKRGELKLEREFAELRTDEGWESFLTQLQACEWVSYIQPPPTAGCSPGLVLKYLARYLTGGPISDARIQSADASEVTILAREGTKAGGERMQIPITLTALEFTRRWSLHVLPKGYTKTRRFGGWSNPRRDSYLEQCCRQLDAANAPLAPTAIEFGPYADTDEEASAESRCPDCPNCGAQMILHSVNDRPSWRDLMHSASRPGWYRPQGVG